MIRKSYSAAAALLLLAAGSTMAADAPAPAEKEATAVAAVFVKSRADGELAGKTRAFEDLLVGAVTRLGFRIISREDAIQAVGTLTGDDPGDPASGGDLDALLDSNTSALRLAQNLQADYLLVASLSTLGRESSHVQFRDVDRKIDTVRLRVAYKILEGVKAGSVEAGTVAAEHRMQRSDTVRHTSSDVLNTLLADAAEQIGDKLEEAGGAEKIAETTPKPDKVTFLITCGMQDLSIPAVTKTDGGDEYALTGNRYQLEALNVTVSLDGTVLGTAPGKFEAYPGLHKMRLTRPGFLDWERTVNITADGQQFNIPLQLSEEGMKRWRENTQFLNNLKRERRLDDAEVKKIEAFAEMMRKSGYRIDIQGEPGDISVHHDEGRIPQGQGPVETPAWP